MPLFQSGRILIKLQFSGTAALTRKSGTSDEQKIQGEATSRRRRDCRCRKPLTNLQGDNATKRTHLQTPSFTINLFSVFVCEVFDQPDSSVIVATRLCTSY